MTPGLLQKHQWLLLISICCLCGAEEVVETSQSNLQHPKHQPQDLNAENNKIDLDEKVHGSEPVIDSSQVPHENEKPLKTEDLDENPSQNGLSSSEVISNEKLKEATEMVENEVLNPDSSKSVNNDKVKTENENVVELGDEVKPEIENSVADLAADDATEETPLASFKEFRAEQMEKEKETKLMKKDEKRKSEDDLDAVNEKPKTKLIQKNYADNSCGAKIVDNKKEFKNCGTILNNNKDLYAMIPCEGPIWFVVELCDTIQINALQLANYELFSSSIKEFKVYTAETYPPKEWKHLGTFETVNNRQIQKFDVENHGDYSKYVRFEKITSRGKEHFCVLSTFEVLGMSMVDEYEEVQHQQDEEVDLYEQPLDSDDALDSESTDKSLIQGAKDTVKNIVDSALNVLGVSKNEEVVKNDTMPSKADDDTLQQNTEKGSAKPTEESVIIKVDEAGKEIKKEEGPEKRLKGEEDIDVPVDVSSSNFQTKGKPDSQSSQQEREAIMEAVDLSKNDDETYVSTPVKQPEDEKPDTKKSGGAKGDQETETVEQISPTQVKGEIQVEGKPVETVDLKTDAVVADKGVVMTNSPKKNSIFVELDKKIKELEKNLSLSNDYLETLSSRYKRVDQSFKPLQKTLSTIDEVMVHFEERLKVLESKFDRFEERLDTFLLHMEDSKTKSNTLITTSNLILFLLLIMFYFLWRMSYKVNQISYCVFDQPRENKATFVPDDTYNHKTEPHPPKKRQRSKHLKDPNGLRSRDTSPRPGLLSFKSESNLPKKISSAVENKKPLESVQMDLIYPQQKSPTLKRRNKHVR